MVIPAVKPKVTDVEKKYREDTFPDVTEIKNKNVLCTSCGSSVKELVAKGRAISHPFLETLLCEKCFTFYGDGNFSVDEDGSDKYCRWCGQGGTLFLCSQCTAGFCKKCVKRNVSRSALAEIENDDWACYCCNATPLFELRAQCWAAKEYASEISKGSKSSSKNKKSKRPADSSDENEEQVQKKKKAKRRESQSDNEEKIAKDDDQQKSKKKRKEDSKRNDKKSDRLKSENGDNSEREPKRSLRERKSKNKEDDDDELVPGSEISKSNLKYIISKFNDVVTDCARMTKEVHKKMLECKAKKINFTHINSLESVSDLKEKLNSMLVAMEDSSREIRTALDDYCREWVNTILEEKKTKGEDKPGEDAVENGISNETSERMDVEDSIKSNGTKELSDLKEDKEESEGKDAEEKPQNDDITMKEGSSGDIGDSENGNKEDEPDSSGEKVDLAHSKEKTENSDIATEEEAAKDTPPAEEITSSTSEDKEKSES